MWRGGFKRRADTLRGKRAACGRGFPVRGRIEPAAQSSFSVPRGVNNLVGVRVVGFMGVRVRGVAAWPEVA